MITLSALITVIPLVPILAPFPATMSDLFEPTLRRAGRANSPLRTMFKLLLPYSTDVISFRGESEMLGVSLTVTAVARATASVIVVVGPPFPPVVSPIGLSLPKPTRSKSLLLDLPSKDGAAAATQAKEAMTRLLKNFMIAIYA
jgi:hypothetical protein